MADRFTFIVLLLLSKYASAVKIGFIGDSGAQTSSSSTGFHGKHGVKPQYLCSTLTFNITFDDIKQRLTSMFDGFLSKSCV